MVLLRFLRKLMIMHINLNEHARRVALYLEGQVAKMNSQLVGKTTQLVARNLELADMDVQLAQRQAQVEQLTTALHQLQEQAQIFIGPITPPVELEEDPEEIQGMSGVDDN
jgi:hypothetical protein